MTTQLQRPVLRDVLLLLLLLLLLLYVPYMTHYVAGFHEFVFAIFHSPRWDCLMMFGVAVPETFQGADNHLSHFVS